jgi:hypothetical protein
MADIKAGIDSEGDGNLNLAVNNGVVNHIVERIQRARPSALQQLPRDVDFVGRVQTIAELEGFLAAEGTVAISAVAGMGGVGKSALAIHVAHRLAREYNEAQLYINLQGASGILALRPEDVIQDFLKNFGLEDADIAPLSPKSKQDLYRSILSKLKALLVLDNAQSAAQVEWLLPGMGSCRVLVTSRENLALAGVQSLRLEVMLPEDALDLLLLVSGRQHWTASGRLIAIEIVELCGRLPLALRIAGAILQKRAGWRWEKLRDQLKDKRQRLKRFAELHKALNPAQDLDVRSSFAVSYELLEPSEQQVLSQAAAIPGQDFGLLVAQAVIEAEQVEDCLARLGDLQLLENQEHDRYRFHDLVRLFGQEKLIESSGDSGLGDIGKRSLTWYIKAADDADDCFIRQLPEAQVLIRQRSGETLPETQQRLLDNAKDWFEIEWGNLKDLVQWADVEQQWPEAARLPLLMKHFAAGQGHQAAMPSLLDIALNAAQQVSDRPGEANCLEAIGDVQQFLDQRTEALEKYEEAIKIYRQVGARRVQIEKAGNKQTR